MSREDPREPLETAPAGPPPAGGLFAPIFTTDELADSTSDRAWLQAMLDVEAALSAAEADLRVVPPAAAESIRECCRAEGFDPGELGRAAGHPVVPLVQALRSMVPPEAADWVHHGATSQDVLDSAAMLVARRSTVSILDSLDGIAAAAAGIAVEHRATLITARTILQPALPTTLGVKAAGWCVATLEAARGLRAIADTHLAVQLGGAAGTLAALGTRGLEVGDAMASRLGLAPAPFPWHTDRTRPAELASALGVAAGVAGKIALDVALLMQNEVGEAREPAAEGRGSSSTMPHKRNPVLAASTAAAVRRAHALAGVMLSSMVHEHERAAGGWQTEWETLGELPRAAGGASAHVRTMLEGLEVDSARMAANLDATRGILMAERLTEHLTPRLGGKAAARLAVERAVARAVARALGSGRTLAEEIGADEEAVAALRPGKMDEIFDERSYLGEADTILGRALAPWQESLGAGVTEGGATCR